MGQHQRQLLVLALLAAWGPARAQLPAGGQVAAGVVSVTNVDAYNQQVVQGSDRAIINWQSFSIGAGHSVRFEQPSASSVILNRVVGSDLSSIFGTLSANGQVFLVNPNGIYFAPGARLDVGGLVATTLGIRDGDFMAGRYWFDKAAAGGTAKVINEGVLKARENGYVVLAGDYVANRGIVEARLGTVLLGSANRLTLDIVGDSLVDYTVSERNVAELAGVANSGQLLADGGRVVMTASTARNLAGAAVNNSGLIQARGVAEEGGSVLLLADGGDIALAAGSSIDVSGDRGGGTVLVGGNFHGAGAEPNAATVRIAAGAVIAADAKTAGDGGKVAVWADEWTSFKGAISARGGALGGDGGFVEVSGKQRLGFAGTVDTRAPQGRTGTLLLDPANITISNAADSDVTAASPFTDATDNGGTSNLNVTTLETALATSNVTVSTATASGADAGIITVQNAVAWASTSTLFLVANNAIALNAQIAAALGTLSLTAGAGVTQTAALAVGKLALAGTGTFTLTNAANSVGTLAADVTGAVNLKTSGALTIGTAAATTGVNTHGNSLRFDGGGNLTQEAGANLSASSLELLSSAGTTTLTNSGNSVASFAAATHGATSFRTSAGLTVGTVGATSGVVSNGNAISLQSGAGMTLAHNVAAGAGGVTLASSGGATQTAGSVTAASLELSGAGTFTLASGGNDVDTLGGNLAGALNFRDADGLSIGNPSATDSLDLNDNTLTLTVGGPLSQTGALRVNHFELLSSAGTVNLANAGNSIAALGASTQGDFTLRNNSANLYLKTVGARSGIHTNNHNFTLINDGTGALWLGDGATNGPINVGTATADLSSWRVLQYGASPVVADKLALQSSLYAGLSGTANWVNTLAVKTTGGVGTSFDFLNSLSLTIGTVGSISGITTQNTDGKVAARGNITATQNMNLGTGRLALFAISGSTYYDLDASASHITAGALAIKSRTPSFRTDNAVLGLAGDIIGSFRYTAPKELTIGYYWSVPGLIASGDIWLTTGQFGASGALPAYSAVLPSSDYRDDTGKYRAGLMIDERIISVGGSRYIHFDSASGVYQRVADIPDGTPDDRLPRIFGNALLVTGEGQFDMQYAKNAVGTIAADVNGSFSFVTSSPLTVGRIAGFGKDVAGVRTRANTVVSGTVGDPLDPAQYNAHNILISAADDPSSPFASAMKIEQNITADREGSPLINLAVGASDAHKYAMVATSGSAVVTGATLVLGGQQDRGTFVVKTNVSSFAAAGGLSMYIDNSVFTDQLVVLGLGASQSGSPTPVGDVFLTTGGSMLLLGGKSTGNYLQLRTNDLTLFGDMEMKDGARVLLQPYDMTRGIGVHNANDFDGFPVQTFDSSGANSTPTTSYYSRALLQKFSQTTAFYFGSTPALMNNDGAVPTQVKNLALSGDIHIGADADGGLRFGYRSLSAETTGRIVAHSLGDVFNLRLVAPHVRVDGFNVTGNQVHLFSDHLSLPSAASSYKVVTQKGDASDTVITLRSYTTPSAIWIGDTTGNRGYSTNINFPYELLLKFPDYSKLIFSGSTDSPILFAPGADMFLAYGTKFSLDNRQLTLSTPVWVYGARWDNSFVVFGESRWFLDQTGYGVADWNDSYWPKLTQVRTQLINQNVGNGLSQGQAGGTWSGCPNLTNCTGTNPSTPSGTGGGTVDPIDGPGGGGGGGGSCAVPPCSNSDTPKPPEPPAPAPSDKTNTTDDADNTGRNDGPTTDNTDTDPEISDPTDDVDPGDNMSDGGPSGGGTDSDPSGDSSTDSDPSGDSSTDSDPSGGSSTDSDPSGDSSTDSDPSGDSSTDSDPSGDSSTDSDPSGDSSADSDPSGGSSTDSDPSGDSSTDSDPSGGSSTDSDPSGDSSTDSDPSGGGTDSDPSSGDSSGDSSGGGDGDGGGSGSGSGRGDGSSADGSDSGSGSGGGGADGADGDGSGSGGRGEGSGGDGSDDSGSGRGEGAGGADGSDSGGSGRGDGAGDDGSGAGGGSGRDGSGGGESGDGGSDGGGSGRDGGSGGGSGDDDSGTSGGSSKGGGRGGSEDDGAGGSGRGDGQGGADSDDGSSSADGSGRGGADTDGGEGQDAMSAGGSSSGGGSAGGDSSGAQSDSGAVAAGGQTLCVGELNSQSDKELPDQGGPISKRPLMEVRSGGVNLESDCSRQAAIKGPTAGGDVGVRK